MRRHHHITPLLLGLCLAGSAAGAQTPGYAFDGTYNGTMQLDAGGRNDAFSEPCQDSRPATMVISRGYVVITYPDFHRHIIHYKGSVAGDGTVTAYHRNSNGSASSLSGSVSGGLFNAETLRGQCQYSFALSRS
jgi:hypothetical protein